MSLHGNAWESSDPIPSLDLDTVTPTKRPWHSRHVPVWAWLIVVGIIYLVCLRLSHDLTKPTSTAYYNDLISAFRHGRVDITPPSTYDLSHYQGKWYLYWGASPALFVAPFYAIAHLNANDGLYGCVAGILNVAVFAGCVEEFCRYFQLKLSRFTRLFIILNFAFISPNIFLSLGGTIWFVNQLVAAFYLLLFYYFSFRFLNDRRLIDVSLAAICFGLAWNARLSLIVHGILFVYLLVVLYQSNRRLILRATVVAVVTSVIPIVWFLWYNEVRFSNILEIGYRYQLPAARFAAEFAANQTFTLSHLPHNATYYFLNHLRLRFEPPYLQYDEEGNSVFSVYPLVILAFYFLGKQVYTRSNRLFLGLFGLGLGLNLLIVLMNLGTGWVQFGSRYFFDIVPGLFLLILFVVDRVNLPLRVTLLAYGIGVNVAGCLMFYRVIGGHP